MGFGFKNLVPDKCVFLVLTGIGSNLALTARLEDKYKPYNTGVYDVVVDTWTGSKSTNLAQKWIFDDHE